MTVEAILLGIAQDGGVPHAGCECANCERAWRDPAARQWVACLGLADRDAGQAWLIDATPDFPQQLRALGQAAPDCRLAGVLLTHAHVGHYVGLVHLGREVMDAQGLPLYVTPAMADYLRHNAPWSQLVRRGNVVLHPLQPGTETALSPQLAVAPLHVPHRDEFADTVAFVVRGPARRLFYCPDIDGWGDWEQDLRGLVDTVDVALLDGTFFNAAELPGRDMREVPHPLVTDTAGRLAGTAADVRLVHLNHTNPLLAPGPERDWLAQRGLHVGAFGDRWEL
jgi:pyrroloquinoline quinone biosynthesis protein B